ncbi:RNA-binding protein [Candidatus Roizmanbacteria bacterium CG_4_10_14_0_2_um_filter_36_35]|uniref:RNA-binding protein n=4 Tax=Candidatus Roizmaniibacteriota TaxID=1752723 RepID=A0A2M7BVI2_9BACT|nr:MAG: RNA-binding protein [Candidatus Roizmanbacteria bacterium CG11_big_fil_rev_8_21_14_0_20_35_14]PIV10583.1 MAG: RNA-binding protein [Candidatus Roizmanbacteria bacterium CG03_land_8_20_14_0_80_35_26]PIZ67064.1 MAG: RNA-binding protein [Candidatus Roizmanbacteria bacterium CG_4_10_14_0_2_um_filter_36_35]PJC32502.1 MAG: RNA-binding protein [Candidatus Roizmanbacteria bacterium CG_4_9_14_0_2_um_filter_36_12]PJC80869.1 MAG: RNA-binding protein [Candidatus Roizmanbacteria bacterium CG_4_8_14_3
MNKNKIFVGNLPFSMSGYSLKDLFFHYGQITDVEIISESNTGRSKGFGYITFFNQSDAKKARLGMNGKDVEGQNIIVNIT